MCLILTGLILGMYNIQKKVNNKVTSLKETKQKLSLQKRKLKAKLQHIHKLQEKHKKIQRKINIIKDIRKQQSLPIRYLDLLVREMPEKKIWFQTLQMNEQGAIVLKGIALDNQVFARYIQKLRQDSLIQDIILKQTSKQNINKFELIAFQCQIKT